MIIDYISLAIIIFIAVCALLWMRSLRDKQLIAGEPIKKRMVVCLSNWQLYEMTDGEIIPLGVYTGEIETDTLI